MRKAYEQLEEIVKKNDSALPLPLAMTFHLGKLTEEVGELAQAVNKINGRKKIKSESKEEILDNVEEEAADAIQCIMAIAINAGVKYDSLKKRLVEKNHKFADTKSEKTLSNE
jgi:NTP pyrophosphatase (non-canonical NTP hydrolase)